MNILGVNAYHGDAAACLMVDGRIVAAVEEERFRRIKHWAGFPSESIRYCLEAGGLALENIDVIALNSDPKSQIGRRLAYAVTQRPSLSLIADRLRNQKKRSSVEEELASAFPGARFKGRVERVEHHLAHLGSAFLVSPFDDAVAVSVDGFGDFASAGWGVGQQSKVSIDGRVYFPHSLGAFYQALTQFIGFPHYGDEYKVMGLAPYGQPSRMKEMREIVLLEKDGTFSLNLKYFRHHRENVAYEWSGGSPHVGTLFSPELENLLGPARKPEETLTDRHFDLARSVQAMYEEAFFHLIRTLHDRYKLDTITLAGGCAMNSVANGKIKRMTPYRRVYIQSAAGDAGGAIGAAAIVWSQASSARPAAPVPSALAGDAAVSHEVSDHAYLGYEASPDEIAGVVEKAKANIVAAGCDVMRIDDEGELCRRTAEAVAAGGVIGWYQGRMEWGPRALGNRSIVCDPRRADMKNILNLKIKRRESFRPFAPSVLREQTAEWFEEEDDVPFMMQVYQIREEQRAKIPAVTHVDGSGRLQTVYAKTNPRYHRLISEFAAISGVPMVLNTSFNENEPVVCKPQEALDCFLRTRMDVLVLGDWFIARKAE